MTLNISSATIRHTHPRTYAHTVTHDTSAARADGRATNTAGAETFKTSPDAHKHTRIVI
ncbi:hypothetical protein PYCCODRAFT_1438685 [Trametes coccinea BRFM310]|uniref:Uncharacterized protein n=1 Tax=Trametes coccinea (strain BRFM310) TaxID=1353009 RepID=A0A1Y2IDB3_TRAC3|nr:hypothetical protein PYCCODRAFT_1438685 [Trametes coccinea BRFM310]